MAFIPQPINTTGPQTGSNLVPDEYRSRHDIARKLSSRIGLVVSLVVTAASLAIFGGIYYYVSGLQTQLKDINETMSSLVINRDAEEEQRILDLEKGLRVTNQLINDHHYVSAMLNRVEEMVHPQVFLDGFSLVINEAGVEMTADMSGPSYRILAEQLVSFRDSPFIITVTANEFSLRDDGFISSLVSLISDPEIFGMEEGFFDTSQGGGFPSDLDDGEVQDSMEEIIEP